MAGRIRSIKPEILEDEKAAGLSDVAWRLWVSTWCIADDHGRFRCSAGFLHGQAFWGRPRSLDDVACAVDELDASGLITVYEVNGQQYAFITNWTKHQRVDNAGKARCPGPEEGKVRRDSPRTSASRGTLPPDLRPPTSDPEGDPEGEAAEVSAEREKKPRVKAVAPKLPIPEDWQPTDNHFALATSQGVSLKTEAEKFRSHALSNDRRQASWNHAFTTWLLKAPSYGGGARAGPPKDRAKELWELADRMDEQERGKS
jgi:hypothetical protein